MEQKYEANVSLYNSIIKKDEDIQNTNRFYFLINVAKSLRKTTNDNQALLICKKCH